jgi:hypothetical protein
MAMRLAFCLILICEICFAQQVTSSDKQPDNSDLESQIVQLSNQIKDIKEPTFRVLLRYRLASFLWKHKIDRVDTGKWAQDIALDALTDLRTHWNEVQLLYRNQFRRDLQALIRSYAPDLLSKIEELDKEADKPKAQAYETAFSMLSNPDSVAPAVELMQRNLDGGKDPGGMLIFLLGRLERIQYPQLPKLLSDIVSIEERSPGNIPTISFLSIARFYLKEDMQPEVRWRYFATCLNTIEANAKDLDGPDLRFIFMFLNNIIRRIELEHPPLYSRASTLRAFLTPRVPAAALDRAEVRRRIEQSDDRLSQILTEARAAKDEAVKNGLLREAAQYALEKGNLKLAIDLAIDIADSEDYTSWREQLLGDAINSAVGRKEMELASYALSKMLSPLRRVQGAEKISSHFSEANDLVQARQWANEAVKHIESVKDEADKAKAYFSICSIFSKVDEVRVNEMMLAAIKAMNSIPEPKLEDKADSQARKLYVKRLIDIAYDVIPAFQSLVRKDKVVSWELATSIATPELKSTALYSLLAAGLETAVKAKERR